MKLERHERFKDARTVYNKHGKQSLEQVESETGVRKTMICDLEDENKDRGVRYQDIALLAKHYGVSSDYLLGLTDEPAQLPCAVDELGLTTEAVNSLKNITSGSLWLNAENADRCISAFLAHRDFYAIIAFILEEATLISEEINAFTNGTATHPLQQSRMLDNMRKCLERNYPDHSGSFHLTSKSSHIDSLASNAISVFRNIADDITKRRDYELMKHEYNRRAMEAFAENLLKSNAEGGSDNG